MARPSPEIKPLASFSYPASEHATEGALALLMPPLMDATRANEFQLDEMPLSKTATLWLRRGAKRIFYVSLIRKTGRWVVTLGGADPQKVLKAIRVSRTHFDRWFDITAEDLSRSENKEP